MNERIERRRFLQLGAAAGMAGAAGCGSPDETAKARPGVVIGDPEAAAAGNLILEAGGNVVDAIVAAALTAGVVAVPACGIAGYGGHLTLALAETGQVACIDFNTTAPAALHENSFAAGPDGVVKGQVNQFGWMAAGVPGTLAGMQLALDRFGTMPLAVVARPATDHARGGFPVSESLARAIASAAEQFKADPGSQKLFFRNGKPLAAGDTYQNRDLADLLDTLAERNSVESFYRGDIAEKIVAEFQRNGGVATVADFAAHRAREVEPIRFDWLGHSIYTAPLTAGGATSIEILGILRALDWHAIPDPNRQSHTHVEAMRVAWDDRLKYFGDPAFADVPLDRLLSDAYAEEKAAEVRRAVDEGRPLEIEGDWFEQVGTIHLSAADAAGNMASLTLTHGGGFGARVTVDGLGLILGHGVSRFDPRPGRANSVGPGKRPLDNMCPTVVIRDGRPVLAVGGRGGRRIPNAVLSVLLNYCGRGLPSDQSVEAGRIHTEGGLRLDFDNPWPPETPEFFKGLGYQVSSASVAIATAVGLGADGNFVASQR